MIENKYFKLKIESFSTTVESMAGLNFQGAH